MNYRLYTFLTTTYRFDRIRIMRYTKKQFEANYPDDDACLESVFQNRYGYLKDCPKCGAIDTKFYRVKNRQCYSCMHCGHQLFPLANTIFRKTTTPLKDWFYAIYLFSVAKNGVSAKELERHLGVTYKTAWRMCKHIRILMQQDDTKLTERVEVDETYYGGRKQQDKARDNKTPIIGAVEKGGRLKAKTVIRANEKTVMPFVVASVDEDAILYTDKSFIYYNARKKYGYKHLSVKHSYHNYVQNGIHTNNIENFWGQLKRSIDGTYHTVSYKYLQSYVDEFVFRYNHRTTSVFPYLLAKVGTPVL